MAWGTENGLTFAPDKTVVINFKRNRTEDPEPLVMNGRELPFSKEVKYLGMRMTSRLDWTEHIKEKTQKATRLLFAARRFVGRTWGLRPKLIRHIWQTCVIPIVLYGAHVWAHRTTKKQKDILRSCNRKALILTAPVHKGTPTRALEVMLGMKPLHLLATENSLAAHDRVSLTFQTSWRPNKRGGTGHLLHWNREKGDEHSVDLITADNWDEEAWISVKPATEEEVGRTQVYTDGSKMEGKTGYGVSIWQRNREIYSTYGRLRDGSTVYQAELYAIREAVQALKNLHIRGKISIHSDSRSAVEKLGGNFFSDSLSFSTARAIQLMAKDSWLRLHWVKAHVGTPGNERADELAKKGTKCTTPQEVTPSQKSVKTRYKELTNKQWQTEWTNCQGHGRSKAWFPKIDKRMTKALLETDRSTLATLLQWFTGFCNLMRHRHVKDNSNDPNCRLCREAWETPEHLTFFCPRLTQHRVDHLRVREGWPPKWHPKDIHRFIVNSIATELMTDDTIYS